MTPSPRGPAAWTIQASPAGSTDMIRNPGNAIGPPGAWSPAIAAKYRRPSTSSMGTCTSRVRPCIARIATDDRRQRDRPRNRVSFGVEASDERRRVGAMRAEREVDAAVGGGAEAVVRAVGARPAWIDGRGLDPPIRGRGAYRTQRAPPRACVIPGGAIEVRPRLTCMSSQPRGD